MSEFQDVRIRDMVAEKTVLLNMRTATPKTEDVSMSSSGLVSGSGLTADRWSELCTGLIPPRESALQLQLEVYQPGSLQVSGTLHTALTELSGPTIRSWSEQVQQLLIGASAEFGQIRDALLEFDAVGPLTMQSQEDWVHWTNCLLRIKSYVDRGYQIT